MSNLLRIQNFGWAMLENNLRIQSEKKNILVANYTGFVRAFPLPPLFK